MTRDKKELEEVIADLRLIKEAVSKSDSFFRFIDMRWAMRSILLIAGLMIALFAGIFYYLVDYYGSFPEIPSQLRIALFILAGLAWCGLGYLKLNNFLKSSRSLRKDMTLNKLFNEIFTSRLVALILPFSLAIVLVIVFLSSRGQISYIVPALAILLGLTFVSMSPIVHLSELYLLSVWLIATGLLALYTATQIHPMALLSLTFAAGFILTGLLLYLDLLAHKS